jgi:twitching motility protein PilT
VDRETFERFLSAAVNAGASDVHFKAGNSPAIRLNGELVAFKVASLMPEDTEAIARLILSQIRFKGEVDDVLEQDASYAIEGLARFRANIYRNRGNIGVILRTIPFDIPSFDELGLPPVLETIAGFERGMVLVTGATGSGKSSTLAALAGFINKRERKHIITIEDPIEFYHHDESSRVTQREIGPDTASYASALRAALRQDPDVVMLGEMRDKETIDIALKAAETGHLVLSTVHTTDAFRTINRLLGVFAPEIQRGIRNRLADTLKATISQRLLPDASGKGRVAAVEIMISTATVAAYIRDPARTAEIKDYLEKSSETLGTQSFDQHISRLIAAGKITKEVGMEAATNPSDLERALHFE